MVRNLLPPFLPRIDTLESLPVFTLTTLLQRVPRHLRRRPPDWQNETFDQSFALKKLESMMPTSVNSINSRYPRTSVRRIGCCIRQRLNWRGRLGWEEMDRSVRRRKRFTRQSRISHDGGHLSRFCQVDAGRLTIGTLQHCEKL